MKHIKGKSKLPKILIIGLDDVHIVDLAPSVLYLMGLPVLKDMDGKVPQDIFNAQYLAANLVQYSDYEKTTPETHFQYTSAEQSEIEEK